MERTIRLNFDLSFVYGPRTWRAPLVVAMLLAGTGELSSESVTLTTYYPAPSGVYTNMITTGNTFLARDGGAASKVGVGTVAPGSKLAVSGGMTVGSAYATTAAPADGLIVSGSVGIGNSAPGAYKLSVIGNVEVSGGGYVKIKNVGCGAVGAAEGTGATDATQGPVCNSAQYATFTPGLYVEGWSYQNRGGQVLAQSSNPLMTSDQVRGLDPMTGAEGWMTLTKNDSSTRIWCCSR